MMVSKFQKKKKIKFEIEFKIKKVKVKFNFFNFFLKSQFLLLIVFSKNHFSVAVLTTPVNFWSKTDRTPVFHLDTLN
jgi:hypothetical protein